jgi:hypothetical protein
MVAKVWDRLSVSKQAAKKLDLDRHSLKMLGEVEVRRQQQIEIPNRFVALENVNDHEGIYRAWDIKHGEEYKREKAYRNRKKEKM